MRRIRRGDGPEGGIEARAEVCKASGVFFSIGVADLAIVCENEMHESQSAPQASKVLLQNVHVFFVSFLFNVASMPLTLEI